MEFLTYLILHIQKVLICYMKKSTHPKICRVYSIVVSISKSFDFGLFVIEKTSLESLYAPLVFSEFFFLILNILTYMFLVYVTKELIDWYCILMRG